MFSFFVDELSEVLVVDHSRSVELESELLLNVTSDIVGSCGSDLNECSERL